MMLCDEAGQHEREKKHNEAVNSKHKKNRESKTKKKQSEDAKEEK
jgi:hypothetical protein